MAARQASDLVPVADLKGRWSFESPTVALPTKLIAASKIKHLMEAQHNKSNTGLQISRLLLPSGIMVFKLVSYSSMLNLLARSPGSPYIFTHSHPSPLSFRLTV